MLNFQLSNCSTCCGVDGVDINHRHLLVENFRPGLHQFARLPVQTGALQEQSVDVNPLGWRVVNVLLGEPRHQVLTDDAVQRPALVGSGDLLPHGCEEP